MADVWTDDSISYETNTTDVKTPSGERPEEDTLIINSLKKLYRDKLKPLEEMYYYNDFTASKMSDAYFEAKPMVLLIGQYSVGKTTFIKYLLEREFPGMRVGPEPTTDRFMFLMGGPTDRVIPGAAFVADTRNAFSQLTEFGLGFLSKFECIECSSPILKMVSFIDTPGILSGEKQRSGRGYDFPDMCRWFGSRCDRILLLFDAHKLDISDEMSKTIAKIRPYDNKIKVVLNKADIPTQQLIRVYGSLMWSLGKVFNTPEVVRVYTGSFWDQPLRNVENQHLLDLEEKDLLSDLRGLPKASVTQKTNSITTRARRLLVHVKIIQRLHSKFGMTNKNKKTQDKIMAKLGEEFKAIHAQGIPKSDFPDIKMFTAEMDKHTLWKWKLPSKQTKKYLTLANELINKDISKVMSMVPDEAGEVDDSKAANPFAHVDDKGGEWAITGTQKAGYDVDFDLLPSTDGKVAGSDLQKHLPKFGVPQKYLGDIWNLSDMDLDGKLDRDEYAVARYLIDSMKNEYIKEIPAKLPYRVIPPSKRYIFTQIDP